jgi:hypothetical protein
MKVDITELLIVFDELVTPPTNEELGFYWFRTRRADNLIVTFLFSIYENYVDMIVHNISDTAITSVSMKNCSEIRVLDENKKCLEVVHDNSQGRCFLALTSGDILSYTE